MFVYNTFIGSVSHHGISNVMSVPGMSVLSRISRAVRCFFVFIFKGVCGYKNALVYGLVITLSRDDCIHDGAEVVAKK